MANPIPEKLTTLIQINQNIAAGLMSSPDRSSISGRLISSVRSHAL